MCKQGWLLRVHSYTTSAHFGLFLTCVSINSTEQQQRLELNALVCNICLCFGTIHILRHHIFGILDPPPPLRQHVFSTKNKQKLAFSDPQLTYSRPGFKSFHFHSIFHLSLSISHLTQNRQFLLHHLLV